MGSFDVAQICLNGHIINLYSQRESFLNQDFCTICAEKTITQCQGCGHVIRGEYNVSDWTEFDVHSGLFERPSYCQKCGQAFQWTLSKIIAAQELAHELEGLTEEERELLANSINDIVKNSPRTIVATTRFKKIVAKVGVPVATAFKDILKDVVSETVKKSIWG